MKFWKRITRPEAERRPDTKQADERQLKDSRRRDEHGRNFTSEFAGWDVFDTPIEHIEKRHKSKIRNRIKEKIGQRTGKTSIFQIFKKAEKIKPIRIMDLGCGSGKSLHDIKRKFKNNVKTTGLVLRKTFLGGHYAMDELLVGDMNKIKPKLSQDVIYSNMGATNYTELKTTAVEKIISWLAPDGYASLDMGQLSEPHIDEIKTLFAQNGIKEYRLEPINNIHWVLEFVKPAPRLPK